MTGFAGHGNGNAPAANEGAPNNLSHGSDTMNSSNPAREARAVSIVYGSIGQNASAVIKDADQNHITVRITGMTRDRSLAMVNAIVRLLNGASVFDGADLGIIRNSLWTAKGEAATLAPEAQSATNALGAIESALDHLMAGAQ